MRLQVVFVVMGCIGITSESRAQVPVSARREGRIIVSRGIADGKPGSGAEATFADSPLAGIVIASDGPCTLVREVPRFGLSAGTISITGTTAPITLEESRTSRGVEYRHPLRVQDPAFTDGATITVEAAGGADVPAFTGSVRAPAELAGYVAPSSVSRSGYTARWTPSAGTEIEIMIGGDDRSTRQSLVLVCRVPDTGTFTVPASALALLPASVVDVIVLVVRVARTTQKVGDATITIEAMTGVGSGPFRLKPIPAECSPRVFLNVSWGLGGFSRVGSVPPSSGSGSRLQLGQRLGSDLHLVEEMTLLGGAYVSPYPTDTSEDHVSIGVGVRWTPFAPHREPPVPPMRLLFPAQYVDVRAFYLTAVIGADFRGRVTSTSATGYDDKEDWSPMASLAVGLLEIQGEDWSLGPELREQVAYFDGHVQRGWMALIAIDLDGF